MFTIEWAGRAFGVFSRVFVGLGLLILIPNQGRPEGPAGLTVTPQSRGETEPVASSGDAADDPEVWVHPTDAEKSLILGTDKQGGLHVYGLDGKELQVVGRGLRPNNVDVLYDFTLDGKKVDLAVASLRAEKSRGFKCWRIDPDTRSLADVTDGGAIAAFGGGEPYGCCTYRSKKSGKAFVFINAKSGTYEQYELKDAGQGKVGAAKVRTLEVGSVAEGCVADHELGWLYVAEEARGVWKYGAEPDAGDQRVRVVKVGERGLTADVEGVTLYCGAKGQGYLLVSSQGNNTFKVFERQGGNAFVLTIDPKAGRFGKPTDTDGIAVSNRPLGPAFAKGVFVAQDGKVGCRGRQNFKLYGWEDIAGDRLMIDTVWSPRDR